MLTGKRLFNIVLVSPKIPQNTGNIGRSCVAIGAHLHIVKPIPFFIDEKSVKRAGMDYWDSLQLSVWNSLAEFSSTHPVSERHFFATTKAEKTYFEMSFQPGDFIYFGSEDEGLPKSLLQANPNNCMKLPMKENIRSLNLSSAVCAVAYEAVRQNIDNF